MKPRSMVNRRVFLQQAAGFAGGIALVSQRSAGESAATGAPQGSHPLVAVRISAEQWLPDERFVALVDFLEKYHGTVDEVAFFTSGTHPPLPLAEITRRAECLAKRMPRIRARGMSPGINLLATMGHHEENLAGSLDEPWPRVMDPQGAVSRGSYCPASDELLSCADTVYTCWRKRGRTSSGLMTMCG